MPSISDVEARDSPGKGRGLFATTTFEPGKSVLTLDRPLVAVLDRPLIDSTCAWCFASAQIPGLAGNGTKTVAQVNWCTGCKKVKYCGKRCQSQAWRAHHKRECNIFAAQQEPIPSTAVAVLQVLQGLAHGDHRYRSVLELNNLRDDFEKAIRERWDAVQLLAGTCLRFMSETGSARQLQTSEMATCIVMSNSSRLVTPSFDPIGLSLDPLVARINHSCSPNAILVFDGPRLDVRALERIHDDTEITISYVDETAPFGVRQSELKDQYFFTCTCMKCALRFDTSSDAFNNPGPGFDVAAQGIDDKIAQIEKDPAWQKHVRGTSPVDLRLSALEYYAYSFLRPPDERTAAEPARLRKAIAICRNSTVFPLHRAPIPQLYQQYATACLDAGRFNDALIAMIRTCTIIDPLIFPAAHHPVRVVHAWTLALLARYVGGDQDSRFCQALQRCGVDLSMLSLSMLSEAHAQVLKSHGEHSWFASQVQQAWEASMRPGGELDVEFGQVNITRQQWTAMLEERMRDARRQAETFAQDETAAAQVEAVARAD